MWWWRRRLEPGTLPPSLSVELDSSTIGLFSLEMGSAGKENITQILKIFVGFWQIFLTYLKISFLFWTIFLWYLDILGRKWHWMEMVYYSHQRTANAGKHPVLESLLSYLATLQYISSVLCSLWYLGGENTTNTSTVISLARVTAHFLAWFACIGREIVHNIFEQLNMQIKDTKVSTSNLYLVSASLLTFLCHGRKPGDLLSSKSLSWSWS